MIRKWTNSFERPATVSEQKEEDEIPEYEKIRMQNIKERRIQEAKILQEIKGLMDPKPVKKKKVAPIKQQIVFSYEIYEGYICKVCPTFM